MGEYVLCRMQLNMVFENNKMYIIRKLEKRGKNMLTNTKRSDKL